MKMVYVSELEGAALDWAVGVATGTKMHTPREAGKRIIAINSEGIPFYYSPSTDWSQGGPLIDKYDVEIERMPTIAICDGVIGHGDVPENDTLTAVCRGIVEAKLGASVDVPDELI